MSKIVKGKFPTKPQKPGRLINWKQVAFVEAEPGGVVLHFVDGRRIRDSRDIEQVLKIVEKYWV